MILMRDYHWGIAHKSHSKGSIVGNSFFRKERVAEIERVAVDLIAYDIEGLEGRAADLRLDMLYNLLFVLKIELDAHIYRKHSHIEHAENEILFPAGRETREDPRARTVVVKPL